jgi:hypothetical protein
MKIKLLILSVVIFSCSKKNENIERYQSTIDFDRDTVVYKIDVKDDDKKETFLVIRQVYVQDSCFGFFNDKNERAAFLYAKSKESQPILKYLVKIKEKQYLKDLWEINEPNTDKISFPILEKGIVLKKINEKESVEEYKILRIINRNNHNFNLQSINFKHENKSWVVKSREKINLDLENQFIGHCIDTAYLPLHLGFRYDKPNTIDFITFTDDYDSKWICDEQTSPNTR